MSGIVEDVSDANYKEFTESSGAIVAYGLATCEPCKTYDPILVDTAARFPGVVYSPGDVQLRRRPRHHKPFATGPETRPGAVGQGQGPRI